MESVNKKNKHFNPIKCPAKSVHFYKGGVGWGGGVIWAWNLAKYHVHEVHHTMKQTEIHAS